MFPPNTSQEDLIRASKSFDLAQHAPPVDWSKALLAPAGAGHHQERRRAARHLRRRDAGRDRRRDDPAHAERSGVVPGRPVSRRHEDQRAGPVVHVVVRRLGRAEPRAVQPRAQDGAPAIANQQWAIIAPTLHCSYTRATDEHRSSASAAWATRGSTTTRSSTASSTCSSKARTTHAARHAAARSATTRWASTSGRRPTRGRRAGAQPLTFYLSSGGKANTLNGDGALADAAPRRGQAGQVHLRPDESGACRTAATSAAPATRCRAAHSISARWKRARTCSSTPPSRSRKASK